MSLREPGQRASTTPNDPLVAVLGQDRALERALSAAGLRPVVRASLDQLLAAVEGAPLRAFVIDADGGSVGALEQLAGSPRHAGIVRIRVDRGGGLAPAPSDVVAAPDVVADLLAASAAPPAQLERLLDVSLLTSSLDATAQTVARAFGVTRCLLSVRGDSSGGGTGEETWSSLEWADVASRCRATVAADATLVARLSGAPGARCHSYLAMRLGEATDGDGFLALVSDGARVFSPAERGALEALARRFTAELDWRAGHARLVDEVDHLAQGPGLDPVVGAWNRAALEQLAPMQLAAARRDQVPLAVALFDVVDLSAVNHRHGLAVGDALLRRLADAVRAQVREEDLVGRWSGDEIAVMLRGTTAEAAHGVAQRLLAALADRPLELPDGQRVTAAATVGIAVMEGAEGMEALFHRAAQAARACQRSGQAISGADPAGDAPSRVSQQIDPMRNLAATLGGTYRLIHEISRGGMGVVYRAQDLALERPVAIKMLRPDVAGQPGVAERFRIEAAMLARLRHPNLVQVYSFGASGGDWYFVMELVEGESREQAIERCRLEGSSLPLAEIAAVVEQIGSALDALHERGVVHRDVKPANVILDPFRDRAVLVDVGIARRYEERAASAGTPGYVAPEVIAGGEATQLSDVYGLGATCYAMLTLAEPWSIDDGDLQRLLQRQWRGDFTPPSVVRAELAPVDDLIRFALHRDPQRRPASAGAFAAELSRCLGATAGLTHRHSRVRGEKATGLRRAVMDAAGARSRGVAFRSIASAVGVREAERMRDAIGSDRPDLAQALSQQTAPLAWLPTDLLVALVRVAAGYTGREASSLARDAARAAVRASFRRFFPVSPATLVPDSALSAIGSIWTRYHTWGAISCMPVTGTEVVVRLAHTPREPELCAWTRGMLEQVVLLAGGGLRGVQHHACEARGDGQCLFRVSWTAEA